MNFKGFQLDKFQEEAVKAVDGNHTVVVSAATGTGKTLIADYIIDKYLQEGKHIVYTAPIKALSNQKYSDFKEQYGAENVGIMTGDVTINQAAPLKIMTTEIYRNMLLGHDSGLDNIAYTIFDEVHYLGDIERGTVWEESIIFSPENVRFLCLSATIPNAKQFSNWISFIKEHEVTLVSEHKRAVPLHLKFFDPEEGFDTLENFKDKGNVQKKRKDQMSKRERREYIQSLKNKKLNSHVSLISQLYQEGKLPCIYFCFSRAKTQSKAKMLIKQKSFLSSEESVEASNFIRDYLADVDGTILELESTRELRQTLSKGVGFHHAGVMPALKGLVEKLFSMGLIKVLFATETFAVGINMPAKTVCFDSLEKFDGMNFRYLNSKEFFQLAGRAGRRGLDKEGFVISVIEKDMADLDKIKDFTSNDKDPLKSQFSLSYNTILNLLFRHSDSEILKILDSNLYTYQSTGRQGSNRIRSSFKNKKSRLAKAGFLTFEDGKTHLTDKGLFGMRIYTEELLVSEIFSGSYTFSDFETLLICIRIVFEPKKNTSFDVRSRDTSNKLFNKFRSNPYLYRYFKKNPLFTLESFIKTWYDGNDFLELLDLTNMPEGDIIRLLRQVLDLLSQIEHATSDQEFKRQLLSIMDRVDRDVISVRF